MIGILDYGCGNLRSVENALAVLGLENRRVASPEAVAGVDRLLLPGVGHYGHAMSQVRSRGLEEAVKAFDASQRPILGICLGMQVMFEGSEEAPGVPGLGLLPGCLEAFADPALKVPHMGWSPVDFGDSNGASGLPERSGQGVPPFQPDGVPGLRPGTPWGSKGGLRERSGQGVPPFQPDGVPGLRPGATWGSKGGLRERSEQAVPPFQHGTAYFVHGYFLPAWIGPRPEALAMARHGRPFVAAFRSGHLAGCQFHPEKSGPWGLGLLKEMTTW